MNAGIVKNCILAIIDEYGKIGPGYLQSSSVLGETAKRLNVKGSIEHEQIILTVWHELFRTGHLAWGYNLSNPGPPFLHLSELGRKAMSNFSRDPVNPTGYMAYLDAKATLNPISRSYLDEALKTFNNNCIKASAVMIGCALESIILHMRDILIDCLTTSGADVPRGLTDWKIKTIINTLEREYDSKKSNMPRELFDAYDAFWNAFIGQIRIARNDSGHPKNVDPVTVETVHSSLLIFPEVAKLVNIIESWMKELYQRV